MTTNRIYQTLIQELQKDNRLVVDGKLAKNKIIELALQLDSVLIKSLLSSKDLEKTFFQKVDDVLVFDKVKFQSFVSNKQFLPDSFTEYKNKIGLISDGQYITESNEVVLAFPYKDCVLEGGQTKEESKRSEVFWNETLAPDEIDKLLESKVLTRFKRYDQNGESEVNTISTDENLIIKGNNLLALHTLKNTYKSRIKLIYIDPPYYFHSKKKEDTFAYNSNFKLSTWLTFMQNRLQIAKDLLSETGAIAVQISDDGVGELHTLLKEIFNKPGENNFINKITVKTKSPSGFASVNAGVFETAEYILIFAKNKKKWTYNPQYVASGYDENYKWIISNFEENHSNWKIEDIAQVVARKNGFMDKKDAEITLKKHVLKNLVAEFALANADRVFQSTAIGENAGKEIVEASKLSKVNKNKIYKVTRSDHYDVYLLGGREMAFYSKKIRLIDGIKVPSTQLSNIWTDVPYEGIAKEGNVVLKGGKKPEKLVKRIIEMSTNEGDLVLDYHLGSGTTCAVAHKLKRNYIGIEQLDYQDNDSVMRLKNVITGDPSGISKTVGWKGGGSFIYAELAKANQHFVDKINNANNTKELLKIWDEMKKTAFLSYRVKPEEIDSSKKELEALLFEDQQRFLVSILDKNLLYVPYSEIDDKTYSISKEDKELNKKFYGDK